MKSKDVRLGLVVWDWKGNRCEVIYVLPTEIGGYILRDLHSGTKRYAATAGKMKPVEVSIRQRSPEEPEQQKFVGMRAEVVDLSSKKVIQ